MLMACSIAQMQSLFDDLGCDLGVCSRIRDRMVFTLVPPPVAQTFVSSSPLAICGYLLSLVPPVPGFPRRVANRLGYFLAKLYSSKWERHNTRGCRPEWILFDAHASR